MTTTFKALEAQDRKMLHDIILAMCLDGHCYAFAIALNRGTGWPMFGLMKDNVVRHAVVRDPIGVFHDARGEVIEKELGRPFGLKDPYVLKSVSEEELFSIKQISEYTIESASKKAQILWPELPWKSETLKNRIFAFSKELEAISRKHGLWLRAFLPTTPPVIAEDFGKELGYELGLTIDGSYTIRRSP
jgi:hypothetical protein